MSALTDPGLSADPPQRQYVGVRVRLPVRELLRKIRLSKGMDPNDTKDEQQTKVTKGCPGRCSGRAEKRRAHPYTDKQLRQSKNCSGKARKALEDLDILVEFQLQREENLLRNIPVDKLLAPDENGNRLLHKAVTQGKRALAYALARKYACLNKIDEKDAAKRTALHLAVEKNQHLMASDLISLGANINEQDSLGKTPLHLCAENGYLRVLEVLRNYKARGLQVEVNAPDHYGLTPLHCAAHAHTILMVESQRNNITTDARRFLKLRRDQILEGISCLLQMGADRGLQILKSYQTATSYLKAQENHELMLFLQSHSHMRQDFSQEGCSLPSSPRGMIFPDLPEEVSELLPTLNACSQMFDKKGKCC
ncbi:hypothetical protein Y1Q_0010162 [Alligator mississippiensis]|uniref:OCA domain-containing protein n=1 Tax=Alligator mississippiensis TaxID=8496 RepID=A0A151NFY8_ALLMI|nr:hypothetical protein Y1Q_0010162 [Alligator mississippiensis]